MQKLYYNKSGFETTLKALYSRPSFPESAARSAAEIIETVRKKGDAALPELALKFDHVQLPPGRFRVTEDEVAEAVRELPAPEKNAIDEALRQIRDFARRTLPRDWFKTVRPGVKLGEKFTPLDRVGVYIPGGTAPLVSTVVHTAGIAGAVGVPEIVATTPAGNNGKIHPAVLYAMKQAGVTEIYRLGGVYGVAALALGTKSIRKVEKIVGPGNAYVTAAKKQLYGEVSIDLVAGPSEILVLADETANPVFVAADLLSQAEHGSGLEQAVLVTTDPMLPDKVEKEILLQKRKLARQNTIDKVLEHGLFLICARDRRHAIGIANSYAPEHLEIQTAAPENWAKDVNAAGAIFLGAWTPEPIGDFCAGPSHVLPTASSAHYFNGVETVTFFRRSSLVQYSEAALKREVFMVEEFAKMEGLGAHGNAGTIRVTGEKK